MGTPKSHLSKCVLAICLLALTNFVAGRLGLLLAIPPGYATAVFPPAGIALGSMLLFGYRIWPGVFLGSLLLTMVERNVSPEICLTAASIAAGSTVQAIAGAWLIRKFVGFPTSLDNERSIAKFFMLGGPLSCLVATSLGTGTLCFMNFVTSRLAFNWFNWWVGDTIGVLIFTPLMLVAFGQPKRVWRARRLSVGVPLVLALSCAVLIFFFAKNREAASIERDLELASWQAWLVLTGGLSFTSLLGFVLLSTTGRSSRVEELVEQRTKELVREQQLLHKLIELQDRERQIVALDIHDGFVQEIVGAQMLVESANHNLSESSRTQIEKASTFLRKGIDEARRLIGDLRPMVIEELGVVEAIKHLIADQEKQYGMTVVFIHEVEFDRLDPTLEGVIFRIVQEALRNVVHHAETQHAVVRLKQSGNNLMIEIRDTGKGFDPPTVPTSRFGVRGIQDRARIFGGSASIESTPGEGTIVRVLIPITDKEPANLPPPEFYI
jgi:signal transduction histidine kinase